MGKEEVMGRRRVLYSPGGSRDLLGASQLARD